ncbi:hypothetical protein D3C73_1343700 [compost metagenome]
MLPLRQHDLVSWRSISGDRFDAVASEVHIQFRNGLELHNASVVTVNVAVVATGAADGAGMAVEERSVRIVAQLVT